MPAGARPMSKGKTFRVRIPVAVGLHRKVGDVPVWNATGWNGSASEDCEGIATEGVEDDAVVHWIEADVPMPPEGETIEGRVVE